MVSHPLSLFFFVESFLKPRSSRRSRWPFHSILSTPLYFSFSSRSRRWMSCKDYCEYTKGESTTSNQVAWLFTPIKRKKKTSERGGQGPIRARANPLTPNSFSLSSLLFEFVRKFLSFIWIAIHPDSWKASQVVGRSQGMELRWFLNQWVWKRNEIALDWSKTTYLMAIGNTKGRCFIHKARGGSKKVSW